MIWVLLAGVALVLFGMKKPEQPTATTTPATATTVTVTTTTLPVAAAALPLSVIAPVVAAVQPIVPPKPTSEEVKALVLSAWGNIGGNFFLNRGAREVYQSEVVPAPPMQAIEASRRYLAGALGNDNMPPADAIAMAKAALVMLAEAEAKYRQI